ncbi:MAG: FHA domain-containing protein [Anaerolineales bacterium]
MSLGKIRIRWPDGRAEQYEIAAPTFSIGRAQGNEIVLDHESVARRHVRITVEARRLLVEDLGSANGTFIAGLRIAPNAPSPMTEYDTGRIGDVEFRYQPAPGASSGKRIPAGAAPAATGLEAMPEPGPTESTPIPATRPSPVRAKLEAQRDPVVAGNTYTAQLTVVNQDRESADFRIHVSGIAAPWAVVGEERITLLPGSQKTIPVTVRVPRAPEAVAGDHKLQVSVFSRKHRTGVTAEARLRIQPFAKFEMRLEPVETTGEFIIAVDNQGNAPASYRFSGRDDEGVLHFKFGQPAVTLKPGQRGAIPVIATAAQRPRFGAPRHINFNIVATPLDGPGVESVEPGLFTLNPVVPIWMLPVFGLLVICLCIGGAFGFVTFCPDLAPGLPFCPGGNPPVVNIFAATPDSVEPSGAVVITWDVANAARVDIQPDIGPVESTGVRTVNPSNSVRYVLTAVNEDGSTTSAVQVEVHGQPPIVAEFSAQPAAILRGQVEKLVLTWSVPGADIVRIVGLDEAFESAGSTTVPVPSETITYTLLAGNEAGQVQSELTIPVTDVACRVANLPEDQALSLREGPAEAYREILGLGNGTVLTPISRTGTGEWLKVQAADREGWVSTIYVECDVALLTFVTARPELLPEPPTATATNTPQPSATGTGTQPPTNTPTATPTATATSAATHTPTATATLTGFTSAPPSIDGVYAINEWADARLLRELPNGKLFFMNDAEKLYLLVDLVGDTTNDPPLPTSPWGDYFWLTVDVNENAVIDANVDINYQRGSEVQFYTGPNAWTVPSVATSGTAGGFGASPDEATPHRIWEVGLRFDEIAAAAGEPVRIGLRTYSQNPSFTNDTPINFAISFADLIEFTLAATP